MKLKGACSLEENSKAETYHFANKSFSSQNYDFSSSFVQMWKLNHKEDWAPKSWCFQTVVLEKTLISLLSKGLSKLVNPKGNQSWIFIGRTDVEAEAPILRLPDEKSQFTEKDPDVGSNRGQEKKGMTEEELAGWVSPSQWTWVWANSGRYWRTGKPGMLPSMRSQRVWATEQQHRNLLHFYTLTMKNKKE